MSFGWDHCLEFAAESGLRLQLMLQSAQVVALLGLASTS